MCEFRQYVSEKEIDESSYEGPYDAYYYSSKKITRKVFFHAVKKHQSHAESYENVNQTDGEIKSRHYDAPSSSIIGNFKRC